MEHRTTIACSLQTERPKYQADYILSLRTIMLLNNCKITLKSNSLYQ